MGEGIMLNSNSEIEIPKMAVVPMLISYILLP